jgi:hypothetical protein
MRAFDQRFADVYNDVDRFPSLEHVAAELEVSVKTVRNRAGEMRSLRESGLDVPQIISRVGTGRGVAPPQVDQVEDEDAPEFYKRDLIEPRKIQPHASKVRYFIFSSAQDASEVHEDFVTNLEAYARHLGAELMIAGFTYSKKLFQDHDKAEDGVYYHRRVEPYLTNDQVQLGDGLVFCGEMNTLPTATMPLSGFETYTRDKWGIFPHAKIQLQAVATAKFARTKQLMTTGCVTMPNYVPKKAGIKASFHHQIGAVLVELMPDGTFFCRHLHADGLAADGGGFYDLDVRVENGKVTTGHRVEAMVYGDIHHEKLDPEVALTTWGYDTDTGNTIAKDSLLDRLRPKHQFFHDLSDFAPRNHHNIRDPHFLFKTHKHGTDDVEEALRGCSRFLARTKRDFCTSVVVQSNHDNALLRWLKEADFKTDPVNAVFYLRTQTSYYEQLAEGIGDPPIFEQVLRDFQTDGLAGVEFVSEDDSYMVDGVEHAMHGHLGANGARGNPRHYTKMGSKSTTGHTHSPQIVDGAFVVGVSGNLDMGYNRGLSSWDHSHVIQYPNGTRTIITMMEGRWFAPRRKK